MDTPDTYVGSMDIDLHLTTLHFGKLRQIYLSSPRGAASLSGGRCFINIIVVINKFCLYNVIFIIITYDVYI